MAIGAISLRCAWDDAARRRAIALARRCGAVGPSNLVTMSLVGSDGRGTAADRPIKLFVGRANRGSGSSATDTGTIPQARRCRGGNKKRPTGDLW